MRPRKQMDNLRLFQTAVSTDTLGPFRRFCVWVQGCQRGCPGCVSPEAQPLDGGYQISVEELAGHIAAEPDIEGITVSGGEPYLQSESLCRLLGLLRAQRELGVIVYTGYLFEEVRENPLTQLCDAVIDGSYVRALDDGLSLRGSSNQRICFLTDRYRAQLRPSMWGRSTELVSNREGGLSLVGVPSAHSVRTARRIVEFLGGK